MCPQEIQATVPAGGPYKFRPSGPEQNVIVAQTIFYWPNLNKDCQTFIRQCERCQRTDKAIPRPNQMIERQVVTQPCQDLATRWPEAVPIKSTTARVIISVLTGIFVRSGFPVKVTTDNKGNWAKVIPMALYFVRCTPSATTGVSPFLATHGWEPQTPLQVLYQAWVDQDLGPIDLSEWIDINTDRVEQARDIATSSKIVASTNRAKGWNERARDRIFKVGDQVLIRRPGLDAKLRESWEGPGVILAVNSPVSYRVQTDKRTMSTVNVQQLKEFMQQTVVKRVTSVLQRDTKEDDITNTLGNARIDSQNLTELQAKQLKETLDKFENVLDKEPGLTSLVEFQIDTGEAGPIYQHPYNTPVTLRASVDKEIDWLLERGFIRPSSSPWASPMVTVKKADGSARLCVDFRKINGLTRQTPFYMPRVEEVLEGVGKARFISKLDLSKGYYQVRLAEASVPKTAFTSHRGVFEFTRMPFGVKNAPACFQALMQRVLADQREWATAYMDDVVVYSRTWEEHLAHISRVLEGLRKLAKHTAILTPMTSKQAPQRLEWTAEGGVLQVKREDHWQPAAYFSRQLRGAEHRYSATELEALALGETVAHFGHYLYGRPFTAYTDHRPLEQLLTSTRLNPRLARLAFKLQHWLLDIEYLPGEQNTLADALSREERVIPDQTISIQADQNVPTPGRHPERGDVGETPPH